MAIPGTCSHVIAIHIIAPLKTSRARLSPDLPISDIGYPLSLPEFHVAAHRPSFSALSCNMLDGRKDTAYIGRKAYLYMPRSAIGTWLVVRF